MGHFGGEGPDLIERPIRTSSGPAREFEVTIDRDEFGKSRARGRTYVTAEAAFVLLAVSRRQGRDLPAEANALLDSLDPGGTDELRPVPTHPLEAWGVPFDPRENVAFTTSGGALRLTIPGWPFDTAPEHEIMNAPRVLAPACGDFSATVRVYGPFEPGVSKHKGLISREAGGLIAWKDARNYIVFQRRATNEDGRGRREVVLEELVDGRKGVTLLHPAPEGATHLRLEREGRRLLAAYGGDGEHWEGLEPVETSWADGVVQFGVVAASTSPGPHAVTFEGYALRGR